MPDESNPYLQRSLIEFQAFCSNNGLVQDACLLVLVCVIGTLREFQAFSSNNGLVKFMFSKQATKIYEIFNLTLCSKRQIDGGDFINICGLLGKHELYTSMLSTP